MKKYNRKLKRIASLILLGLLIASIVFAPIVMAAADITIDSSVSMVTDNLARRGGIFWTTNLIGYVIYIDSTADLSYQKTSDGGATWGGAVAFKAGDAILYDAFADWQVAGDTGTKIHCAYIDSGTDDVRYIYLDTATDTVGGDDQIEAGQGIGTISQTNSRASMEISITKTRGGNLAVAFYYPDSNDANWYYSFYTSPDATTWTGKVVPWETAKDYIQLYPANLADNNDLWAVFLDCSANAISLKTYDNSANDWVTAGAEAAIAAMTETGTVQGFDGQVRLSDGDLICAFWNLYDNAAADLQVYDIANAGSITAKTNIITDEAESICASVFINQVINDIYVAYFSGSAAGATVQAFSQHSHDGGATWSGETAMQVDAEDDERWISAGCMKSAWGGMFQPVWFNDDLNDLFTNAGNGVSIAASGGAPSFIPKVVIY